MPAIPAVRAAVTSTVAPGCGAAADSSSSSWGARGLHVQPVPLLLPGIEGPLAPGFPAERHRGHVHAVDG